MGTTDGVQEVAGSNPVAPTVVRNKPFGEHVEGLSHFGDESYVASGVKMKARRNVGANERGPEE